MGERLETIYRNDLMTCMPARMLANRAGIILFAGLDWGLRGQTVAVTCLLRKDSVTCHRSLDGGHRLRHIDLEEPD